LLETPGQDGHGPTAEDIRILEELHARSVKKRRQRTK
jgi:hypothetical protein